MHNMIIIVFVLVNVNIIINKLYGINNNKEKIYVLKVKNVNIFYLQFHLREYQKKKMNINVYNKGYNYDAYCSKYDKCQGDNVKSDN